MAFFTRDSIYAVARICHGNSVCLSVRPSHGGSGIRRGSGDMRRQTRKWSYKHDKLTQCCRACTLALARLSCNVYRVRQQKPRNWTSAMRLRCLRVLHIWTYDWQFIFV